MKFIKNKNLLKNKKAQLSMELLMVIGVIVLVAVIFVAFYLNTLNKRSQDAEQTLSGVQINANLEKKIVITNIQEPIVVKDLEECGNGVIDPLEVCDIKDGGVFPEGFDCSNVPNGIGETQPKCIDCIEIKCA